MSPRAAAGKRVYYRLFLLSGNKLRCMGAFPRLYWKIVEVDNPFNVGRAENVAGINRINV